MNPRIAVFVATSGHSGVDRAMQHLIPAIARRGYPIDLLHVKKHGPNLDLASLPANARVVELGTSHVYNSLPAVIRYLRRERPTVMLSDKDRVNRTAMLARALSRVDTRLVLSSGTTISIDLAHRGRFECWLQRNSMGKLYRYAEKLIVTCEGVADDTAAYTGLPREHIETVPSPVIPAELFTEPQPRPEHPWFAPGEPPVILAMGEVGPRKGFDTLIRAFALLRQQRDCRLVILGRGRLREELIALAETLGVAADLDLPGFQARPYGFLAHAAVFAFTSRYEGLGFALIEALALGTPAVATDCPSGPSEILRQGLYGPLVAVDDHEALARALQDTLDAPLARQFLQQAALPYEIERATSAYLAALGLDPRVPEAAVSA
jgi:glycosyltransferase involved in cell wall biosynthesis